MDDEGYVSGRCVDGPLAGQEVTVFNALGASLTIATLSSEKTSKKTASIYEVVALASPDEPAALRFVGAGASHSDYPQGPLRSATDLDGTLDDTP